MSRWQKAIFGVTTSSVEIETRIDRLEDLLKRKDQLDVAEKDELNLLL